MCVLGLRPSVGLVFVGGGRTVDLLLCLFAFVGGSFISVISGGLLGFRYL